MGYIVYMVYIVYKVYMVYMGYMKYIVYMGYMVYIIKKMHVLGSGTSPIGCVSKFRGYTPNLELEISVLDMFREENAVW